MRNMAQAVVHELELDYAITMVSGGESGKYEIVMWDRPRNSYFSVRVDWRDGMTTEAVKSEVRRALQQRNVSHALVDDRRPARRWSAA